MWLDAGIGLRLRVRDLPILPHLRPVVGSETCASPNLLDDALIEAGDRPVAFSIDLKAGRLLGNWQNWGLHDECDAVSLARHVIGMGVGTLIVLDLARVGTGTGTGTEPLLRAIRDEFPDLDLIAGGGVRTWADVDRLGEAGATGVLVASALHNGALRAPRPA
ncbi:Phosphoribosylformimino-5-aminoimidazole carboxamide ribotide isomerase related protein [Frigoriglobus tundricola]|uniref:Phosphoribosylformimino-5-aminoimidazole carboxamide ribotide isomerase related protein n=2 Tax=Frigoriglobus tundricola TaxID=2774151 RepID=A0A6M5YJI8_9BACT|nr:Phosphoribosylformimino-5-aminoimidazole carboxamide ribotide isomerase related protein [Frigoriglobus tundricola]